MKKLGVALIGCGAIATTHADAILEISDSILIGVFDTDIVVSTQFSKAYQCKSYMTLDALLQDSAIDVIHVCTPHDTHATLGLSVLKANKHLFLEKPVGTDRASIHTLIEASKTSNVQHCICFQNRMNPTSQEAYRILRSGELGAILGIRGIMTWYRPDTYYTSSSWRGTKAHEGGSLLVNQAIHTLDLMQWLVGSPVASLQGTIANRTLQQTIECEDTAEATLHFANNVRGLFYASNGFTDNAPVDILIHCEKGTLRICDNQLVYTSQSIQHVIATDTLPQTSGKSYWGSSHHTLIQSFYSGILTGTPSIQVPLSEGLNAFLLTEALYASAATGQPITL